MTNKPSFLKNHADTIAIISINVAIAVMLVTMIISNSHRIDAVNARADAIHLAFYDLLKEVRK